MTNPMISVIMPVYNAEKYVAQAIESILKQTYSDFEFIIVDDCSTDNSYEILQSYAANDARIRLFKNDVNSKLPKTLNFGISQANGKYIARMDADDISLPERFAQQVGFMDANPAIGVCGTWFKLFVENIKFATGERCYPSQSERLKLNMLFVECSMAHPSVMIRKSIFQNNQPYELDYISKAEDYELWCRLIRRGILFTNLPEFLFYYRVTSNQISQVYSQNMSDSSKEILYCNFNFFFGRFIVSNEIQRFVAIKLSDKQHLKLRDLLFYFSFVRKIKAINKRHSIFDVAAFNDCMKSETFIGFCYRLLIKIKKVN